MQDAKESPTQHLLNLKKYDRTSASLIPAIRDEQPLPNIKDDSQSGANVPDQYMQVNNYEDNEGNTSGRQKQISIHNSIDEGSSQKDMNHQFTIQGMDNGKK